MIVAALIALDLGLGVKRGHAMTAKEALRWVILWILLGVSFGLFILNQFGPEPATIYFAAYTLEYTLSVDNVFVFAVIMLYFQVPSPAQPIVLYSGVIGAILMRATFIAGGIWLLSNFHWMVFVFAAILLYSGLRIWRSGAEKVRLEDNPIVKLTKRILPMTDQYSGVRFTTRQTGKLVFTPLIVVLLAIESSDIMFAFDSVPAALALTNEFFLAYTSNISAILGLRSLYFLIAHSMFKFKYIGKGLAVILGFLGVKFLLSGFDIQLPTVLSLVIVFGTLTAAVGASMMKSRTEEAATTEHGEASPAKPSPE